MGSAPTPPGLLERIMQMVDERIARFARSGFLRNATISDGGLTIKGGFLRLRTADGLVNLLYVGPFGNVMGNGEFQQVVSIKRADGTTALRLYDAFPGVDGELNQALSWVDRAGNTVVADDTDSGQGLARPWVPFVMYRARNADWPTVTGGSFTTVYRAKGVKQQPRLYVEVWANAPDAGAVAEVQIVVNDTPWDVPKSSTAGFVSNITFGPLPVDGDHMSSLSVDVQYRLQSGTGVVQCGPARIEGRQS